MPRKKGDPFTQPGGQEGVQEADETDAEVKERSRLRHAAREATGIDEAWDAEEARQQEAEGARQREVERARRESQPHIPERIRPPKQAMRI